MGKSAVLSVRITGNADDALTALGKVQTKAATFGAAVGTIASKGVTALWDKVTDLAKGVTDMSDSMDKFKNTMSFAGLDTKAIDKAAKATRDYADRTVYSLGDVQNTTAQLAANGIKDYTGLTEAAGNLNAIAGGNADTFASVAMVLTQTAGAGKLTTENWNQLADAIPGASGKLQEALKKNKAFTGNFRDAMAKGQITADEFNQALMDLGMSDAAQQAATSTQTMEGAIGNLEAAITGGMTDAFGLVKPTVTTAMSDMATAIGDGFGKAVGWANGFAGALSDTGAIDRFGQSATALGDAVSGLASTISAILKPIGDMVRKALGIPDSLGKAGDAGKSAGQALDTAASVAQGLADKLTAVSDWCSQHSQAVQTSLVAIAAGLAAFKAATLIQAAVTAIQGFSLATQAAAIAQGILNAVMAVNPFVLIATAVAALVAGLVWFVTQTQAGQQAWQSFCGFVTGLANSVVGFIQGIPGKVTGFFAGIGAWFTDKFNTVKQSITGAFATAVGFIQGIPGKVTGFFTGIAASFATIFTTVKQSITDKFTQAVDFVKGIPGKIKDAFSNPGQLLKDIGKKIIDGFLAGLKDAFKGVQDFVGGIGDWITQHKGPPSYDQVMLVRNGRLIMQGLATGIREGYSDDVEASIEGVTRRLAATTFAIGGIAGTGTGAAAGSGTVINITVNGVVGDTDQTARRIKQILQTYADRRQ